VAAAGPWQAWRRARDLLWRRKAARLYLLFLYPKNERSDLTRDQLRTLRKLIEDENAFD
jgi:hypothetical protein